MLFKTLKYDSDTVLAKKQNVNVIKCNQKNQNDFTYYYKLMQT